MSRAIPALVLLLLLAGCQAEPMTYQQWRDEQAARRQAAEWGIPYTSPSELRAEAAKMRKAAAEQEAAGKTKN